MILSAVSGIETSSLRSSSGKDSSPASPSRHLRCQVSARFRPRTTTDSPALHPFHSAAAIRKRRRSAFASFQRLQTAETVRTARARPEKQDTAIRREAPPVAEDTVVGREASPGQDIGNSREHGHFPDATLRWRFVSPPGKVADLTDGGPPQGVGLTLRRQAACGSAERGPCTHRVAARALRSVVEESDSLASRCRDCAGNESADLAKG